MDVKEFVDALGGGFYTGVPDSQLKPLCDYLMNLYGIDPHHHIIAANEGNCVALAAGYYLATGKIPVVYLQNSGEGNIINPVASLLNEKVYGIPVVFVIGWRGEPGAADEPQHICQGEITAKLLEVLGIPALIVDKSTREESIRDKMKEFHARMKFGKSVAFLVRKDAFTYEVKTGYKNRFVLLREEAIQCIADHSGEEPVVVTTGKASRELFEIRQKKGQGHERDFLTVGSMGHCSSIALGIALGRPETRVWCIDGDGAALMHMGSLAVIGSGRPQNLIHIIINNGAHESVGGMPTAAEKINFVDIAKACRYPAAVSAENLEELKAALKEAKLRKELCMIEVKCAIGAREDLGRPTIKSRENKEQFMNYLSRN